MSTPNTKARITEITLMLFNHQGVASISTNHIALELDISPGNLYYHFKSKEALIDVLFTAYESELRSLFNHQFESTTIEDAWFFLHLGFEIAARYRFVHQDTEHLLQKCPSLIPRFKRILRSYFDSLLSLLNALSSQNILHRDAESSLEELATNMLLVCTQWISFKQHFSDFPAQAPAGTDLSQGVAQALSMVLPYLNAENQAHLRALQKAYS